jgi:hypothetical protein
MLPKLAQGSANKVFVIPSEFSQAINGLGSMLGGAGGAGAPDDKPAVNPPDETHNS